MEPRQGVKVESSKGHDRVVGEFLPGNNQIGSLVPDKAELIKGAKDGLEVGGRSDKERHVLEIGVMLGHVGDEMVDIVRALPPAYGETTAKIGNEGSDQGVDDKIAGNSTVSSVVCGKHDLLLERRVS